LEDSSNFKILTIDDESYIRQSIRTYLEDYGFIVFEAENGQKGLEVFDLEKPDLVLLDLRMPEMDGLQVLEILNDKAPDIPLVIASGTGNITAVVEALHLGAWDYILKPIEDMSVLYHSVQKCLKESQLKKENKQYQERLEELVKERTLELQQSEQRYKAIFEYTGTAAIIIEPDDTISMVNSKFCEFAGLDSQDIAGLKKWYDFVAPEDIEVMRNYIDARVRLDIKNYAPMQYEIKFISNDGQEKYVYVSLGIIPGTDRAVVSLLDVTEKKKAEQRWHSLEKQLRKAQKMEAIGTLAGGIAHDLNNILSPVLGYADMIMRSSDPAANVYKHSEKIQKAALRAADLVSQVLSFNRRGEEEKRLIKIHPVSKEVLKLLKGSIPSTITIVDSIDRTCGSVEADPTQIHQVIMNLCTNAYHAMEETGGTLTVGLKQLTLTVADMAEYPHLVNEGGDFLAIEVSDTGCGMPEDVMERIFDPYFTTKEPGEGTGLGLAVAHGIAVSHGGTILVESQPGSGSSFEVLLPCRQTERAKPDIKGGQNLPRGTGNVLFVDDEESLVDFGKIVLERVGYKVKGATSSIEALKMFKESPHKFDLVITDHIMPKLQGMELAKKILEIRSNIPVMLCTGTKSDKLIEHAKNAGIIEVLQKPIPMKTLINAINHMLAKQ